MKPDKAPAYWPTRIMLAVGFIATAVVVVVARALIMESEFCFGCTDVLGLPSNMLGVAPGVAVAVFGLVWMLRIFRGHRDKPPAWRYRDR